MQVAEGQALLADLHSLSKSLPQALRWGPMTEGRYAPILFDYRYFKDRISLEQKIEASPELQVLDDQFREVSLWQEITIFKAPSLFKNRLQLLAWVSFAPSNRCLTRC